MQNLQKIKAEMTWLSRYDKSTQEIILAKRSQPPVSTLKPIEKRTGIEALVVKISVITGWIIPASPYKEVFLNAFEQQIEKEYPHLNLQEMELAFMKYGTRLPDYGKEMNLSLFTAVLDSYRADRKEAERNANLEAENRLKIDPMTDDQMINEARGEIEFYYQQRKRGNDRPLTFPFWAEVLVLDKFIGATDQMESFFNYCLQKNIKNIYEDVHSF